MPFCYSIILGADAEQREFSCASCATRPSDLAVAFKRSFETARAWIDRCLASSYKSCRKNHSQFFPTRVLDIWDFDNGVIKFHHGMPGEKADYIPLSHCWGGLQLEQICKSRLSFYFQGTQLQSQPQTIQDAALAAKELGIRYFWIDALCRVQGDPNDKARGISNMAQIYQNALLTVSAASGCSSVKGFLPARKPRYYPISTFWHGDSKFYINPLLHIRCLNNAIVATGSPPYI